MLLLIDHYDSFIDMIADYCKQLAATPLIMKTDQITPTLIIDHKPTHIIIGPGPGNPNCSQLNATRQLISMSIQEHIPVLGICLGHQLLGAYFGGKIINANLIAHGICSEISHNNSHLFRHIPRQFTVTRYHSLIIEPSSLINTPLQVTAQTLTGEIMALQHRQLPIYGVQFHPEAVMTEYGLQLLSNFLN